MSSPTRFMSPSSRSTGTRMLGPLGALAGRGVGRGSASRRARNSGRTTPGQGGFPKDPRYLGPFMPWMAWRHMSDEELWSIIAYLRYAVKPVNNTVPLSDDAPDHWVSAVAAAKYPAPPFPTANEIRRK